MPLTVDSILQENSGGSSGTDGTSVAVTLTSGTTAGSTLIVVLTTAGVQSALVTAPTGWVKDVDGSGSSTPSGLVYRKPSSAVTAGETSWTWTLAGASKFAWYAAEVVGLDPDDPLDASASAYNATGVVMPGSFTRTTGTTAANSGTDTVLIGVFIGRGVSTSIAPGTWSAYTNGFEEVATAASATAASGSATVGLAVTRKWSGGATTGPFESTGTYTSTNTGSELGFGVLAVYRASDSPVVNPLTTMIGFENGTHYGLASSIVGGGVVGITGTPGTDVFVETASARSSPSVYGCRIVAAAAAKFISLVPWPATVKNAVLGFDVQVVSGSGTVVVAEVQPFSGTILQLVYDVTNTQFGLRWGSGGTVSWQSGTTALGAWAWIDLTFTGVASSTWHAAWRLETGTSTYTDQTAPADLTGQTGGSLTSPRLGGNLAQTVTLRFDNVVASTYASGFPLGPHTIQPLKVDPAGTPTVNGTVGNFALVTNNATGAALTSGTLTSARDAIDDLPVVISASSDGVVQTTAAASDYLQFPMDTFTVASGRVIAAVRALAVYISTTGAGAGNLGIRGYDGTNESTLYSMVGQTPGSSTTLSATVPPTGAYMWNPVNGWTQAKLDAAALRLGFSSDATPDMGVHAMYLEVATRAALVARQLSVEDDVFTVDVNLSPYNSASVSYVLTSNDATRGATFNYSVLGVAQTPVYVAAASSTTVDVTADAFGDVNPDSFEPDPA